MITGETYTLSELFSGNIRVIIPDLQRDYCWGDPTHTDKKIDLVSNFVENLHTQFNNKGGVDLSLGLIYGYEEPETYLQLCDGQQRITTLYLLIGMLNRRLNDNCLRRVLISDYELDDDREPYLQYSIRESSLYFLSDLVCKFFTSQNNQSGDVKDLIKQSSWYFSEYNQDPSVQSMINALAIIDERLNSYANLAEFATYIATKLTFMYYDMGSRKSGEETFVIINTTGEPLSAAENLKPHYVNKYKTSDTLWEQIEQYFWINKCSQNDTADSGVMEFLRWVVMLESADETSFKEIQESASFSYGDLLNISPNTLERYFEITKELFGENGLFEKYKSWLSPNGKNEQKIWFRLLPVILFIKKFPDATNRDTLRVKQTFENIEKIVNVTKAVKETVYQAVSLIKKLQVSDIATLINIEELNNRYTMLLSDEVRIKFGIYLSVENRDEIEDRFWVAESHPIFSGEISTLINWSNCTNGDMTLFDRYWRVFTYLFGSQDKFTANDLMRRALITRSLCEYPKKFSGYTNFSFATESEHWQHLITANRDKFKELLSELAACSDIDSALKQMIETLTPSDNVSNELYEFAKEKQYLEYCTKKIIQKWGDEWILIPKTKAASFARFSSFRKFVEWKKIFAKRELPAGWNIWFYNDRCFVIENSSRSITFDICYYKADKDSGEYFTVELFRKGAETKNILSNLADNHIFSYDDKKDRYCSEAISEFQAEQIIYEYIDKLDDLSI